MRLWLIRITPPPTKLLILVFWVGVAFAFIMALLPKPPRVPFNPSDKIQHMIAFGVLACLASHAYFRTSLVKLGLGLAVFGALIEVLQSIPLLHRDSSAVDWLADCAAIAVVLGVTRLRELAAGRLLETAGP